MHYVLNIELGGGSTLSVDAKFPDSSHDDIIHKLDTAIRQLKSGSLPYLTIEKLGVVVSREALMKASYSYFWAKED
jgi:hypothetical protein